MVKTSKNTLIILLSMRDHEFGVSFRSAMHDIIQIHNIVMWD